MFDKSEELWKVISTPTSGHWEIANVNINKINKQQMNKIKNMAKTQIQHDQQIHLLYKIKRFLLTRMIALQTPSFQILCKSICSRFQTSIAYHTTRTIKKKKDEFGIIFSKEKEQKQTTSNFIKWGNTMFWRKISLWNEKDKKKSINDSKNQ